MSKKDGKLGFFGEFKKFIARGNIMDMAVGVVVGSAFTAIVNSLVNDILTPLLGLFSKDGFTGLYIGIWENGTAATDITLKNGAVIAAGEVTYRTYLFYGTFIQAIVNFLLIAFSIFCLIKIVNKINDTMKTVSNKIEDALTKDNEEEKEVQEVK